MCESFLPILYLHLCYSIIFPTMSLFVRVLSNMIDPTCCVCCLVTISSCLFLMQTMPKFDCCKRSLVYVAKAFEGHENDKVILISSTNSAIVGVKPVTWKLTVGMRIEFTFRTFSFENHVRNKNSGSLGRSLYSLTTID